MALDKLKALIVKLGFTMACEEADEIISFDDEWVVFTVPVAEVGRMTGNIEANVSGSKLGHFDPRLDRSPRSDSRGKPSASR
jgi:hypothetical protein